MDSRRPPCPCLKRPISQKSALAAKLSDQTQRLRQQGPHLLTGCYAKLNAFFFLPNGGTQQRWLISCTALQRKHFLIAIHRVFWKLVLDLWGCLHWLGSWFTSSIILEAKKNWGSLSSSAKLHFRWLFCSSSGLDLTRVLFSRGALEG